MNVDTEPSDDESREFQVPIELTKAEWDILIGDLANSRVTEIMSDKGIEFDTGKEDDRGHYIDIIVDGEPHKMVTDKDDFGTLSYETEAAE